MADEREAAEEIEGHIRFRANEPGPDAENADLHRTEGPRASEEPGKEPAEEPEIDGHIKRFVK